MSRCSIIGGTGKVGGRFAGLRRDAGHVPVVASRSRGDVVFD